MPRHTAGRANAARNKTQVAEEQIRCYNLRLAGLSLDLIAKATGLSKGTVNNRINAEIKDRVTPLAEEVRQMQLDRLDSWLVKLTEQIKQGRSVARNVEVAIRVEERRAKLLGVDEAERADITVHQVDQRDLELSEMLREAKAQIAAEESEPRQ